MKTFDRNSIVVFIVSMICIGLLKMVYIPSLEGEVFSDIFYQYYIFYGESPMVNLIWLAPTLFILFFVGKEMYLRLMNFNIRYHNRNRYIREIFKLVIVQSLGYLSIGILIQLVFLLMKVNIPITINLDILLFIIKYSIEIVALTIILLLLALLLENFTYSFLVVVATIVILLLTIRNFYIPFISLYVSPIPNVISIIIIMVVGILLYKVYVKKDLHGGKTR